MGKLLKEFEIGHAENKDKNTGVTVIISRDGAIGGVSVRGGAPATRETDLLKSENMVEKVNAVVLSGGSAYGLDAASGVMQYLKENNIGFKLSDKVVPIVVGASIYDLDYNKFQYPDAKMGYLAAENAKPSNFVSGFDIGAGAGATVGKLMGMKSAEKAGVGCATASYLNGLEMAVISVVNAFGDIYNAKGEIIRGFNVLGKHKATIDLLPIANTLMMKGITNTTISCILTNARITKTQANKLADVAHDGYAHAIRPVHTTVDGDAIFLMSSNKVKCEYLAMQALVTKLTAQSVRNAVANIKKKKG